MADTLASSSMFSGPRAFTAGVRERLSSGKEPPEWLSDSIEEKGPALPSSVLFLLGPSCRTEESDFSPCLILNKRSRLVRQPGDLCCPGGSISPRADFYLARLLGLPGSPLARWKYWKSWRKQRPDSAGRLRLLLATSLRESIEEMRLNPLAATFLGPLPPQRLIMFKRVIYPMVGWISSQRRFFPNWEVEKIVRIPIEALLRPDRYGRYRVGYGQASGRVIRDYPCFTHNEGEETELLWGATFRITMTFLETVFGFTPPAPEGLPVVSGKLDRAYFAVQEKNPSS